MLLQLVAFIDQQASNTKPKAVISNSLGTYVIEPGQTITFDGRASYDLDGGGIAAYHWFENGSSSHSSDTPTFVKTYYSYGNFTLKLRVTDHPSAGHNPSTDEKTVTIQVRPSVAGTKYYITDHLGSVRSTVNHLGQVVGQEDFSQRDRWSYGLTMPGRSWNNGNAYDRYKFTGHERDSEGGLDMDYMIARNYDPEIGRFMGVDPLYGKRAGLSPYNYAQNNPILRIDPDGKLDRYYYNTDKSVTVERAEGPNEYFVQNESGAYDQVDVRTSDGAGKIQEAMATNSGFRNDVLKSKQASNTEKGLAVNASMASTQRSFLNTSGEAIGVAGSAVGTVAAAASLPALVPVATTLGFVGTGAGVAGGGTSVGSGIVSTLTGIAIGKFGDHLKNIASPTGISSSNRSINDYIIDNVSNAWGMIRDAVQNAIE